MIVFFNCCLLCFSREEEFSKLPFRNKVTDEKKTCSKAAILNKIITFGVSQHTFGISCFVMALASQRRRVNIKGNSTLRCGYTLALDL